MLLLYINWISGNFFHRSRHIDDDENGVAAGVEVELQPGTGKPDGKPTKTAGESSGKNKRKFDEMVSAEGNQ